MAASIITAFLQKEIPGYTEAQAGQSFADLGVDSFGMLELRAAVEGAVGAPFADKIWMRLETPAQLLALLPLHAAGVLGAFPGTATARFDPATPYLVRRVHVGDALELANFSRRLWPERDPQGLARRWWLRPSPAQCFAAIAASDGSIGGICGARAQRVVVRGAPARAVGICDWFVDPVTRGSGVGRLLAEAALRDADVGWSSSLSAAAESAFVKLGFEPVPAARMPLFLTPSVIVAARNALARDGGLRVECRDLSLATLASVAAEIEQARALRQDASFTGGARDLDAWRSHLALVPNRVYQAWLVKNRRGELAALAVSRRLPRGAFPRLGPTRLTLVSELLCDLSQPQRLAPLFRQMALDAVRRGSELMHFPVHDPPMHEMLAKAGFFSALASCMNLRVARLATRFMIRQSLAPKLGAADWRMTALDCDFDLAFGGDA